jgi:hypothetical protein
MGALVVVACVAGIPPLVDVAVQAVAQSKADAALAGLECRVCGVVEDVREVRLGGTGRNVSTVSGEGFALFLGLLSGKLGSGPSTVYEVAVRLQDGSTRILREGTLPAWKAGDRVKVKMGRILPA